MVPAKPNLRLLEVFWGGVLKICIVFPVLFLNTTDVSRHTKMDNKKAVVRIYAAMVQNMNFCAFGSRLRHLAFFRPFRYSQDYLAFKCN